mmetsp:Transcript_108022/g.344911  ORF Transcript_108022/g.344911 Transcript_108022/m.344911 type:complete len:214 (+) Transcript_108022:274-915(+)
MPIGWMTCSLRGVVHGGAEFLRFEADELHHLLRLRPDQNVHSGHGHSEQGHKAEHSLVHGEALRDLDRFRLGIALKKVHQSSPERPIHIRTVDLVHDLDCGAYLPYLQCLQQRGLVGQCEAHFGQLLIGARVEDNLASQPCSRFQNPLAQCTVFQTQGQIILRVEKTLCGHEVGTSERQLVPVRAGRVPRGPEHQPRFDVGLAAAEVAGAVHR